ncbi:LOW QUALITY PROTEIN: Reverse transcriptase [Phytophthora palmivora]|uniref:Reverse transcriptase n=1 Tax=Phytophthora palmivora TaxID=4796 RepID=A0A2P4YL69_9STRA|nr:LOW QUALITY PROTEIN: Reverse transcriptase [Phytophthora palmivora]
MNESAMRISSVCNEVPRGVKNTTHLVWITKCHTPPAQPVEEQYHVSGGVSNRQVKAGTIHLKALPEVSALLNLEELSMKDFLAELKAGDIVEIVLLKPETSPEDLNSSSVMDEDVLEGFTKQRATRLGSEILKNPEDPSKSPHSTPNFCVRKPNGKWRLVHAYNKLNNATVPAQTPIPRKDVLLNNMLGCTLYSALDLVDGYYQILMRKSDIPLAAHPERMLWEWLVMPQRISNSPATFNRVGTQLFRLLRTFAQTYFDDIFVHSRAEGGQTAMEVHLKHLRRVFEVMRANKFYANIGKCDFAAEVIKVLGGFVSRVGVRADPGKVKAIAASPTPRSKKDISTAQGTLNLLILVGSLKEGCRLGLGATAPGCFDSIKAILQHAPVLALPDENKSFSVVCDASNYAIVCAMLQKDDEGRERVISFLSRQLKATERIYPVHDKELLAMKNALVKFRPGKLNVLADALSRRPDYELAHVSRVTTDLYDRIRLAYQEDENYTPLVQFLSDGKDAKVDRLSPRLQAQLHRYGLADGLFHYRVDPGDLLGLSFRTTRI